MHHERMSPDYEPPPPAYENQVADSDDIVLHSKRGSYVHNDDVVECATDIAPEAEKTQV